MIGSKRNFPEVGNVDGRGNGRDKRREGMMINERLKKNKKSSTALNKNANK
jgi:hypothetical protein